MWRGDFTVGEITMNRQYIELHFKRYIDTLLSLPEIEGVKLRGYEIKNDNSKETVASKAFEESYHDRYSDSDIILMVKLKNNGNVTEEEYIKHHSRWGVTEDNCLGFFYADDSKIYRIIFADGTRYDMGFEFRYDEQAVDIELQDAVYENNIHWSREKINEFWFVIIQALGKLYRHDYLISSHLANVCINDTLVQQMILRDIEYGTNHHRYGYSEKLLYQYNIGQIPFHFEDKTFEFIAEQLYAAALTYDKLTKQFYPAYKERSPLFVRIWKLYNE